MAAWSALQSKHFQVFNPSRQCENSESVVYARWALTWKTVDGEKNAKARLVAKGYQDADLKGGSADPPGCGSVRSPHRQVISLGA